MLIDALGIDAEVASLSNQTARDYAGLLKMHLGRLVPESAKDQIDLDLLSDGLIGMNVLLAARWMHDGFVTPWTRWSAPTCCPTRAWCHC